MLRLLGAVALACVLASTAAEARPAKKHPRHDSQSASHCEFTNEGRVVCPAGANRTSGHARVAARHVGDRRANPGDPKPARAEVRLIPHPAGCPRVRFCACGLARYWGLGKGLNLVATWPKVFPKVHAPGIGVAAVRRDLHHVLGIVGGGPGAWRVIDFNSGNHKSRTYTTASFHGYFFVDTRPRTASR